MKIINIFKIREYIVYLCLIIIDILTIIFYFGFGLSKAAENIFLFNISIIILFFFYCIFLESEFNSSNLRNLKINLENKVSIPSLIISVLSAYNFIVFLGLFVKYILYKIYCPFTLTNMDYKLHLKRRCELYNINRESKLPYQYICSYNAEKIYFLSLIFIMLCDFNSTKITKCSRVGSLINNNKVIDTFLQEYYKEDIYYCDLFELPDNYNFPSSINQNICNKPSFFSDIILILQIYLTIVFIKANVTYFRNIRANIVIADNEENEKLFYRIKEE